MKIESILETCLYTRDLDALRTFYVDLLGLDCIDYHPQKHAFFRLARGMLLCFDPEAARSGTLPPHGCEGAGHVAFAVADQELDAWLERLQRCQIPIERIQHWPQGGRSIYFRDPAGNSVELATPRIWGFDGR